MPLPIYLAMTQREYDLCHPLPPRTAWLACQFSPSGSGISHIPKSLPEHALIILTDQFPPDGHHPETVADQLAQAVTDLQADKLILDFQRPYDPHCHQIVCQIQKTLPCPCAVTPAYAENWDQAILIPPIPPNRLPDQAIKPWAGRELWLELENQSTLLTLTESGCCTTSGDSTPIEPVFADATLCCHYSITLSNRQADFLLHRTWEDQRLLLECVRPLGVTMALGLYQQFYLSGAEHKVG